MNNYNLKRDRRGIVSQIGVCRPSDPSLIETALALWDTGCQTTAITESLATRLSLQPQGFIKVEYYDGVRSAKRPLYFVDLIILQRGPTEFTGTHLPGV